MAKNKHIKKIYEYLVMADPTEVPTKTPTKVPTKTPDRRGPSPIRRDKPSVKPKPMASAEDIYDRFINELREEDGKIDFDLKYLASKYKMEESQIVKGFAQYIYEASLEDNPGIPGEGEGDDADKYLRDVEGRANQMKSDTRNRYGNRIPQFMSTVQAVQRLQAGKERELEQLAVDSIREMYGSILDGVKLDIKFPEQGEMQGEMEDVPMEPPGEEIEDENIRKEIYKRKITNNITQGEAKNTKLILNMPFIADGLKDILGEEDGAKMVELLTEITNIASLFDWDIPIEVQKQMWQNKDGFAGTVSVDWEEPDDEEKAEKTAEDIIASLEAGDDILDNGDDLEELFKETTPVIKARGMDFAMLIHETVKGIYQLIAAMGIPEDETIANTVNMNTDTLAGELEDLRYGPYIASDLHKFVAEFEESSDVDNLKEHFFGRMVALPADEFLELVRLILMGDNRANRIAQDMIDDIVQEIKDFKEDGISSYGDDYDEEDFEVDDYGRPSPTPITGDDDTYKAMSNSELQSLIDDALDNRDMDEVKRLAQYLKESLRIQLENKLSKINESKYSHINSFQSFKKKEVSDINENIGDAKNFFIKRKAEDAGFEFAGLTDEERERIERDPRWVVIRRMIETANRVGDAVPFVKFMMDQKAPLDILQNLMDLLKDPNNKPILRELPLKSIDAYAARPLKTGENPGYEMLIDDISKLKEALAGRWIVKALVNKAGTRDYRGVEIPGATPFYQKEAFKNASPDVQNELIDVAFQLHKADPSGREIHGFKRKLGKFKSLEEIKEGLENKIAGLGSALSDITDMIEKSDPGASVIWEGKDKLFTVFRSPETLGHICSSTSWCLLPSRYAGGNGMFYNYVNKDNNGSVQYVFFDYTKLPSNQMHLVGITVNSNGKVSHAHRKDDRDLTSEYGSSLKTYLNLFGIPEDSQAQINNALPSEVELIKDVTPFYKDIQSGSGDLGKVATSMIIRTEKRANQANFKGEEFVRNSTVDRLLVVEMTNSEQVDSAREAVLERFYDMGCSNVEAARYFKMLFEGSSMFTDEIIDKIIMASKRRSDGFTKLLRAMSNASAGDRQRFVQKARGKDLNQIKEHSNLIIDSIESTIVYLETLKKSNRDGAE